MKILICNYEYPPLGGGGGIMTSLMAQELAKKHDITVLTSCWHSVPREYTENGVRVIRVPIFFRKQKDVASLISMLTFIPFAIYKGKNLVKKYHFDLINTHFVLPTGPVGDVLSRLSAVPNVLTLHGGDIYDPSKIVSPHRYLPLRILIKRLLRRADAIVGNSNDTLKNMQRIYTQELEGTKIPLAIKPLKDISASRQSYCLSDDDILFVNVGRLVTRKANIQLIDIMQKIFAENVKLIIVGTGPEESLLKKECANRNLNNKIIFMGHVQEDEKYRILKMSDIYVSTSQHEGFGLVYIEAMHSGLPVVSFDNGGHTEFLENEKTGFIVTLGDKEKFRNACNILIENSELRKTMGEYNINLSKNFTIEKCASRYEALFKSVIEKYDRKASNP